MMKKLLFLFAAALAMAGCKKSEDDLVFGEKPEVRMNKSVEEVNTILASAPNGWIATLPSGLGGGYGFHMSFDRANETVVMYSDINGTAQATAKTSTYRVKANIGAELIFDTYNYISLLADPDPGAMGGVQGTGYGSDSEFLFDHNTADSVIFIGKKYRGTLAMVKATPEQKALYANGSYKTGIDKLNAFVVANNFPYFDLVSGNKTIQVGVNFNTSNALGTGKIVDFTGVAADGKVNSEFARFAYSLKGATLIEGGILYQGITFVRVEWKDQTTLAVYDNTGKEYIVKNSVQPLVPINLIWGTKYSGMASPFKTIYPGTTQKGADILNYFHNNLNNGALLGFSFNWGRITMKWDLVNKRLLFNGDCSQSGGASWWTTTITYSYTVDANGNYKFTPYSPATGGYVAKLMIPLDTFLLNNSVAFDYYIDNGKLYAKMSSVQDPSTVMTFTFQ